MQTIYKYKVGGMGPNYVTVPKGAQFVCVMGEDTGPVFYAIVDDDGIYFVTWEFYIAGTGQPCFVPPGYKYTGSVRCGPWVWHIWAGPMVTIR